MALGIISLIFIMVIYFMYRGMGIKYTENLIGVVYEM